MIKIIIEQSSSRIHARIERNGVQCGADSWSVYNVGGVPEARRMAIRGAIAAFRGRRP